MPDSMGTQSLKDISIAAVVQWPVAHMMVTGIMDHAVLADTATRSVDTQYPAVWHFPFLKHCLSRLDDHTNIHTNTQQRSTKQSGQHATKSQLILPGSARTPITEPVRRNPV